MGSTGGGLKGALDFHLQFSTDTHAVGICDSVPNERSGRVPVESLRMGYAGFDRVRDRAMRAYAGVIKMIEEEYHGGFCRPVNQAMRKVNHSC